MAVYERTYRRYDGALTPERRRFLVPFRYACSDALKGRIFLSFLVLSLLPTLAWAIVIYLHQNLGALALFGLTPERLDQVLPIDARFFEQFVVKTQTGLALLVALILGPGLVSPDLRNGALPLYLSRPLSRTEYVLGKLGVLLVLTSAITWVPGFLLFALQAYLGGRAWTSAHAAVGWAIFASYAVWIVLLSLLALALSAWVKWKPVARILLIVVLVVLDGWGRAINAALGTRWGSLVSLMQLNATVRADLFGTSGPAGTEVPVWSAWLALAAACALSALLLARRVRAQEVVR